MKMKVLSATLFLFVFLISCNEDKGIDNETELDVISAELEERDLEVNKVIKATEIKSNTVRVIKAADIPETTD